MKFDIHPSGTEKMNDQNYDVLLPEYNIYAVNTKVSQKKRRELEKLKPAPNNVRDILHLALGSMGVIKGGDIYVYYGKDIKLPVYNSSHILIGEKM
jgi:hypothetical protein